jgi:dynein heavy chain
MYGGHITDDWDRRTNNTYLEMLIRKEIMNNMQLTMSQGFRSPDPSRMPGKESYLNFVDEKLPVESPNMFGLHPNAEIGYLTTLGDGLCFTILSCFGGSGGGGESKEDIAKTKIDAFLERLPDPFNILELKGRVTEANPYVIVCLQESERMNGLTGVVRSMLTDLDDGLKGAKNITDEMEQTTNDLFLN